MVVPIAIALIRVGTQIYKVASNPAVQAAAKELIKKGIAKTTQSTSKKTINLTANRAAKIVSDKTPGVASKIGGKLRGTKVTTATPGAEKGSVVVGAVRTASKKLGDKVIGGTVIGVPSVAAIAKMKADLKKANTETEREKLRADISDAVGKVQEEKAKAKDKSKADTLREDNNTRRGANEKVPEKRVSKDTPGVKKSLRPKLRPKEKMMGGGMATKKKSTGYMYGGMAKKPKAKK